MRNDMTNGNETNAKYTTLTKPFVNKLPGMLMVAIPSNTDVIKDILLKYTKINK